MNEIAAGGGAYMVPALIGIAIFLGCFIMYVIVRSATQTRTKLALLEVLVREQKKQNAQLKKLIELNTAPVEPIAELDDEPEIEEDNTTLKFVAER